MAQRRSGRRVSGKRLALRWTLFLGGLAFFAGSVLLVFSYFTVQIPDPNAYVTSQATILTYDDGTEFARIGAQNRTSVPLGKIPLDLPPRSSRSREPEFLQRARDQSNRNHQGAI